MAKGGNKHTQVSVYFATALIGWHQTQGEPRWDTLWEESPCSLGNDSEGHKEAFMEGEGFDGQEEVAGEFIDIPLDHTMIHGVLLLAHGLPR